MKLIIELSLDNEAMQNSWNLSSVVEDIAASVESSISWTQEDDGSYSAIPTGTNNVRDLNGSKVGFWKIQI